MDAYTVFFFIQLVTQEVVELVYSRNMCPQLFLDQAHSSQPPDTPAVFIIGFGCVLF